jgi:hypothetical protein
MILLQIIRWILVETRIEHGVDAVLTSNMKCDKDDDSFSPEVE